MINDHWDYLLKLGLYETVTIMIGKPTLDIGRIGRHITMCLPDYWTTPNGNIPYYWHIQI